MSHPPNRHNHPQPRPSRDDQSTTETLEARSSVSLRWKNTSKAHPIRSSPTNIIKERLSMKDFTNLHCPATSVGDVSGSVLHLHDLPVSILLNLIQRFY
jgi:hypothetical protein